VSLERVTKASVLEDIHQHAVTVYLSTFSNIYYLLALYQVGEKVHQSDEVTKLGNDDDLLLSFWNRPRFAWIRDGL
jgi:hypothetical protein